MVHPDPQRPYHLYCDSSATAVGAILTQTDKNGFDRPIHYLSKGLNEAQKKWSTIQREAFAVVYALKKLRPYLYGAEFTIWTDHKPLKALFLSEVNNTKIQRWAALIREYGAPIRYTKGSHNVRVDMLSRLPAVSTDKDRSVALIDVDGPWIAPTDDVGVRPTQAFWEYDGIQYDELIRQQRELPEYQMGSQDDTDYELHNGVLYMLRAPQGHPRHAQLVLPPGLRPPIIPHAHEDVGHQGTNSPLVTKTILHLLRYYKWPGMWKGVRDQIQQCARCVLYQQGREFPPPSDMPVAQYPGQIVAFDLCGPLPVSNCGNHYILTAMDHATGWVDAYPVPQKTQKLVEACILNEFIPRYGAPEMIITDQGLEFQGKVLADSLERLKISHKRATPYHPEANGRLERAHRTLKNVLRKLVNNRSTQWEEQLGAALWAHRVTRGSNGFTPFQLQYGRDLRVPLSRLLHVEPADLGQGYGYRYGLLADAFKEAARNTAESRRFNRVRLHKHANAKDLHPRDHVIVLAEERAPLDSRWDQRYLVESVRGPVRGSNHKPKN